MKVDFFENKITGLFLVILFFISLLTSFPSSFQDLTAGKVVRRLSHGEEGDQVDCVPNFHTKVEIPQALNTLNKTPLPSVFHSKPSKQRFLESLNQSPSFTEDHIGQQLSSPPVSRGKTDFSQFIISFDSMQSMRDFNFVENVKKSVHFPICFISASDHSLEVIKNVPGVTGVYADSTNKIINKTWTSQSSMNHLNQYESFLTTVKLDKLHSMGLTGSGIKIAILDTGIDANHPDLDDFNGDLNPKLLLEASFIDYDDDGIADTSPTDRIGHGTHVAGIAAANGILKGAAPDAWLLNGKVIDNTGNGRISWIINGIDWALTNNADIISLSLSIGDFITNPVLETVIQSAWENDVLVVVSAGNSGPYRNSVSSLGLTTRALTVGALGLSHSIASFSSRGPSISGVIKPDVIAPGGPILSTVPFGYVESSGTSMSAPIVSGLAAVLMSADSDFGIDFIRSAIISTATQLDYHTFSQGAGLIDADQAYAFLQNPSISAFPAFPESSKLSICPQEQFQYLFDVFLNGSGYNSVSVVPSAGLIDSVTTSPLDSTERWVRFTISINMSDEAKNGDLVVKNGSNEYLRVPLYLELSPGENDAQSGTDAGETLNNSIEVQLASNISGTFKESDVFDIYHIFLIQDQNYSLQLKTIVPYVIPCGWCGIECSYSSPVRAEFLNLNGNTLSLLNSEWDWDTQIRSYFFTVKTSGVYYLGINYPYPVVDKPVTYLVYLESHGPVSDVPVSSLTGEIREQSTGSELQFIVEVNITQSGDFAFWYSVSQYREDYEPFLYHVTDSSVDMFLDVGIHDIYLTVPGGILSSSKYNGSYILNDLVFVRHGTGILEEAIKVYPTKEYLCTDFVSLDNRLVSYSVTGADIDASGPPEMIRLELNFYFNDVGYHEIDIIFQDNRMSEFIHYQGTDFQVEAQGLFSLTYEINAQKFFNKGDLYFSGFFASWLGDIRGGISIYHKLSVEFLQSFSPILTWQISDHAYDSDSNGKTDSVQIDMTLTSKVQNQIAVLYNLYSLSNGTSTYLKSLGSWDIMPSDLVIGTTDLDFVIDMKLANAHGIMGPFLVMFHFTQYEGGEGWRSYSSDVSFDYFSYYKTNDYHDQEFEAPVLTISNYEVNEVFDFNGGIQVDLEINSSQAFAVRIGASMREALDLKPFKKYYWREQNYSLQKGLNNVSILFNLEEFMDFLYIGDLVLSYLDISSPDGISYDYLRDFAIVRNHDYREFKDYLEAYLLNHSLIPIDNDLDGLYDEVEVQLNLRVNRIGTYYTNYSLRKEWTGNRWIEELIESKGTTFTSTGDHSIIISIDDLIYVFRDIEQVIYLYSLTSPLYTEIDLEFEFDIREFNYTFPIQVLSISDNPQDLNSDGLYDLIRFEVELDVSTSGEYIFDTRCGLVDMIEDWYDWKFLNLENAIGNSVYLASGVHNLSFVLDSIWLQPAYHHLGGGPLDQSFFLLYLFTIIDDYGPFDLNLEFNSQSYRLRNFNLEVPIVLESICTTLTQTQENSIIQDSIMNFRIEEDISFWQSVNLDVYFEERVASDEDREICNGVCYNTDLTILGPFSKGSMSSSFSLNLTESSRGRIWDIWDSQSEFEIRFQLWLKLVQKSTQVYLEINFDYLSLNQTFIGGQTSSGCETITPTVSSSTVSAAPNIIIPSLFVLTVVTISASVLVILRRFEPNG